MSNGAFLVGTSFNPSSSDKVSQIKAAAADLIDLIDETGVDERTKALAITNIENGAMWAVKSATKVPRSSGA